MHIFEVSDYNIPYFSHIFEDSKGELCPFNYLHFNNIYSWSVAGTQALWVPSFLKWPELKEKYIIQDLWFYWVYNLE